MTSSLGCQYHAPMVLRCPACGGTSARLIAPTLAECDSLVQLTGGAPPPGHMPFEAKRCGKRYAVAPTTSVPTCAHCGTYSVGVCDGCGNPICGDHSRADADGRYCTACLRLRHASDEAKRAEERAAKEQADAAVLDEVARLVDRVLAQDPTPTILCRHDGDYVKRNWRNMYPPDTSRLQPGAVCPMHGEACRVVKSRRGLNKYKRTLNCRFEMPGWKLYSFQVHEGRWDERQHERAMVLTPDRRLALALGDDFAWKTSVDIPTLEGLSDWAGSILRDQWVRLPDKEHIIYAIPESTEWLLRNIAGQNLRGALRDSEFLRVIRAELLSLVGESA